MNCKQCGDTGIVVRDIGHAGRRARFACTSCPQGEKSNGYKLEEDLKRWKKREQK